MIKPARNAPSARESPILEVSHTTARQIIKTLNRNSSRLRVLVIWYNACGTIHLAPTATSRIIPDPFAKRMIRDSPRSPVAPASKGVNSIIGTMITSWKSRMPRVACPWGLSISARSCMSLRTIAVLLSAIRNPMKIDSSDVRPISVAMKKTATMVSNT